MKKLYFAVVMLLTAATISAESEWCNRIIGHFDPIGEGTKDAKSYVRLTVQDNKNGTITFTVAADPTIDATLGEGKAAPDVDYILINPGYGTAGTDVDANAPASQSVTWTVPEGTTVLSNVEILWSFSNWGGRYMVNGLSIPLDEICGAAGTEIEDEIAPVMVAASVAEVSYNSITLNVSGTDKTTADGQEEAVNKFVIDGTTYTAENGQIKIEKLTAGTQYTFQVYAKDLAGNVSENSVTVSATTEKLLYCDFATGHLGDANFGDAEGRILLTITNPSGNIVRVTVKPNKANGATKNLDYLRVYALGSEKEGFVYEAGAQSADAAVAKESLSVDITYTSLPERIDLLEIQWSQPAWDGAWSLNVTNLAPASFCDDTTTLLPVLENAAPVRKVIREGQLYIVRDGVEYTILGNTL